VRGFGEQKEQKEQILFFLASANLQNQI